MKTNRILFLLFMLVSAIAVNAQVTLHIPDLEMKYDETKEVSIEMNNEVAIRALQVRVVLPKGITLASAPQLIQERVGSGQDEFGDKVAAQKSLKYNMWDDGSYMITVNSDDGLPFAGNKGAVIKFSVKADYFVRGTTQKIELKDIELVNVDGDTNYRPSDSSSSISISSNTVTYKVDGNVYKVVNVAYGATITPIAEPTKEGYTFSGWKDIPATMPAEDVVVEGNFTINSYTLTYKVDGEVYATDSIKYGAAIEPIEAPTKEGHTFSGWSEIPETMPAKDVVVEGTFSVNSYTVTFIVDGEVYETMTVEYGATIEPIAEPTKEGYTFSGWKDIPATMPAEDIIIEGSFTINSYTLTYKVDGAVYKTEAVVYGTAITPIAEPIKEGHTFSGWSEIPETMPANDVVIEGSYSVNSYTVTFMLDGEVYETMTVVYGTAITPIAEPIKEGHTFSGWSEIPETMPAKDVVIEGTFSVNSYTVTFIVDGEVYETMTVKYGAKIEPIAEPTKEGYTFSGWKDIPATMPAEDVVVEGNFTINSYTLTYKVDGAVYKTETVVYGTAITPIAEPIKEGHTFSGWSEIPATMPANDIVIEGSFSINSYTVTFMVDGEIYETMTVEYGAEIELPTPPEKEGYIFTGWIGVPATMPAEDIVIEGRFEVDTTGINAVTLNLEKNEVYNLKGQRITESENLTRGIYIVNGKKIFIK